MRILELTGMILTISLAIWMLFFKKKGVPFQVAVGLNTALLVAYAVFERPRWQMGLIYFFAVILLGYMVLVSARKKEINMNKIVRFLLTAVAIILLLVSVLPVLLLPVPVFPEPTGDYSVSCISVQVTDSSRPERYTEDPGDFRDLMVTLWYPATEGTRSKAKPYIDDIEAFGDAIEKGAGVPGFLVSYLELADTRVSHAAPLWDQEERFPLIVFSHGLGVPSGFYGSVITDLVSNGYIVASIEHTYSTIYTSFPNGKVTMFQTDVEKFSDEELAELEQTWVEDIRFVVSELAALNAGVHTEKFLGRMDMEHVGVLGHSFGGSAAYMACFKDDRIRAAINLDGSVYGVDPTLPFESKSFLLLASEDYATAIREAASRLVAYDYLSADQRAEFTRQGIDRQKYDNQMKHAVGCMDFLKNVLDNNNYFLHIDHTKHYNFSDIPFLSPLFQTMGMTGSIDGKRGIEIVRSLCVSFFNDRLVNKGKFELKELIRRYPEVKQNYLQ